MLRKIKLTEEGLEKYRDELKQYKEERLSAITALQRAREMGDLSENAAYRVARSKLSFLDRNIRRIEAVLRRVEVVTKNNNGIIGIGSNVRVVSKTGELTFILVDGYESDFEKGKISFYSPIGRAVQGKKKGDRVVVYSPKGPTEYAITEVV